MLESPHAHGEARAVILPDPWQSTRPFFIWKNCPEDRQPNAAVNNGGKWKPKLRCWDPATHTPLHVISGKVDLWEEVRMKPGNEAEVEAQW